MKKPIPNRRQAKKRQKAPEKPTGLLKLKLGKCLTGPTRRMVADLNRVAKIANRMRNKMVRSWQRWHEDYEFAHGERFAVDGDWRCFPDAIHKETGEPMVREKRERPPDAPKNKRGPNRNDGGNEPLGWLYHQGQSVGAAADDTIRNACSAEVLKQLRTETPYTHEGEARYCWQAYLLYETAAPSYRSFAIPVANGSSILCYSGDATNGKPPGGMNVRDFTLGQGQSSCVLAFPLWSGKSGRRNRTVVCRLEVRQLSDGNRNALRSVARGEWKFKDSKLVRKDNVWYFHIAYARPYENVVLDHSKLARIEAADGRGTDPFKIGVAEGRPRQIGRGALLKQLFLRLEARRRRKRRDYPHAGHGRKGHGRQRNERDVKPVTRRVGHLMNDTVKQVVAEAVKFCVNQRCGLLYYREPSLAWRAKHAWFARHKVQWDWTAFLGQLRNGCTRYGIELIERAKDLPSLASGA